MPQLSDIAAAAYNKAEAADAKEEEEIEEASQEEEQKQDEQVENKPKENDSDDAPESGDEPAEEEAEEAEEEPEEDFLEEEPEEPKKPAEKLPEPAQYVYDRLPTLTIRGRQGPEGKLKEFKVKVPEELPEDFEYASARDQAIFNSRFAQQDRTAADLFKQYEGEQQQIKTAEFQRQEAVDVSNDMKKLQRDGVLPKFKYAHNDRRFNDDPAVAEVQKVLDYYDRKNREFAQQGRAYRVPFDTATREYYVINPKVEKKEPVKPKGDAERREVARKTAPARGDKADAKQRPRPARSIEEILARHSKDFD